MPIGLPWCIVARILGFYCSGCGSLPGLGRSSKLCDVASQKKGEKNNNQSEHLYIVQKNPKKDKIWSILSRLSLAFTSHWLLYPCIIYHDMVYSVGVCNVLITLLVLCYKSSWVSQQAFQLFLFSFSLNQLIQEAIDCQSCDLSGDIIVFLYLK